MNRFEKAAAFGAMMGKRAGDAGLLGSASSGAGLGALVGGGGTALYDYLAGTEDNKLMRALTGAGVGGGLGASLGFMNGRSDALVDGLKSVANSKDTVKPPLPAAVATPLPAAVATPLPEVVPGAGGEANTPPIPRGMQPVPPAGSLLEQLKKAITPTGNSDDFINKHFPGVLNTIRDSLRADPRYSHLPIRAND